MKRPLSTQRELQPEDDTSSIYSHPPSPPQFQPTGASSEPKLPRDACSSFEFERRSQGQVLHLQRGPFVDGSQRDPQLTNIEPTCKRECSLTSSKGSKSKSGLTAKQKFIGHPQKSDVESLAFAFAPSRTSAVRAIRKLFVGQLPLEATRGSRL
jgi:hypothetical protein